jgi:hypothetical protein
VLATFFGLVRIVCTECTFFTLYSARMRKFQVRGASSRPSSCDHASQVHSGLAPGVI